MTSAAAKPSQPAAPPCSSVELKRRPWTPDEDELLINFIRREGAGHWRTLPSRAGLLRCGKSCRLRWLNYLRPNLKRGHITSDEEDLILRLHRLLGNRWALIAGRIPGRTDNEIKNYWNTHLSKKLISQGLDPRTHKPLDRSNPKVPASFSSSSSSSSSSKIFHLPPPIVNPNNPTPAGKQAAEKVNQHDDHTQTDLSSKQADQMLTGDNRHANLTTLDGVGTGSISNINMDEYHEDINQSRSEDDILTSFLNSLMNEDDECSI